MDGKMGNYTRGSLINLCATRELVPEDFEITTLLNRTPYAIGEYFCPKEALRGMLNLE